jgi:HK97 family phage prohead protease
MSSMKFETRNSAPRVVKFVGDRQVEVIASDATRDRMGDVLVPGGCDITNYRRNPVVLAQHDANQPIARATVSVGVDRVTALIEFPPAGTSATSDSYLRLMKTGVISAVSVGFLPVEWEPLRDGGLKYTRWELIELSCVSVPANPNAIVTGKSVGEADSREARLARAAAIKRRLIRDGVLSAPLRVPEHVCPSAEEIERQEAERHKAAAATYDYYAMLGSIW